MMRHSQISTNIELLSAWIEAQLAYKRLPGLSIAIVYDQDVAWSKGFGYANVEQCLPATPDTLYRIASITKLFTATALLQLRDAGKLQLDDPVTKHLSWFNVRNRQPESPQITIRHLITHTSGLPRESEFPYWTDADFPTLEQVRDGLARQEAILAAETRWKYSNLALALAGEIVAAVSCQSYGEYVKEHIFEPLGMHDTAVESPDPAHPKLAVGYGRLLPNDERFPCPFTDARGMSSAFNMTTNAADLARFAMLQFRDGHSGGAQVLSGSTLREMQRVHWLDPNWASGWGLGWRIERKNDRTIIGHGGAVRGYRSRLALCPADKVAIVVLINSDDGEPALVVDKGFQWVAPALVEVNTPRVAPRPVDQDWTKYTGKYRAAWQDAQVLVLNGDLVMIDPSLPDPTQDLTKLIPQGQHTFRSETSNGFGDHGELVVFELDDVGAVLCMKIGQGSFSFSPVDDW